MTAKERRALERATLEDLAGKRAALAEELETVYAVLLDKTLEAAAADDANVTKIAARAGIARATVYNELERRQARAPVAA